MIRFGNSNFLCKCRSSILFRLFSLLTVLRDDVDLPGLEVEIVVVAILALFKFRN